MLLTTPLISTLKACYPAAGIDILLYEDTRPILCGNPDIHYIYGLQRKQSSLPEKAKEFIRLRAQLKKNRYDLIINLADQWPIALLIKSLGARSIAAERHGPKRNIWQALFTQCVPLRGEHVIDQNLSLLAPLNLPADKFIHHMSLYYTPEDAQRVFSTRTALLNQPYIVIQPTARQLFKCWDNDKFARLIDYFKQRDMEVVLTCGPGQADLDTVEDIASRCTPRPETALAGKTSFSELAALLDKAALYIGVDSAPMHMAAALNTPLVCLFGPTNHKQWRPRSDNSTLIWAGDYQAMPERQDLDRHKKYLSCIPAGDVIQAAEALLSSARQAQ
ncbi:lipopolysaccharide core heptosyltransferase RfaQ [Affinibrenneria salicis]|uniref:Lipopolysaccharide core heptosyltransferase RfaQ n=2 Tax=Affinibrenneria salicis TaxID=2590031 RepID=A0A5J5FUU8_9GAMM|nr:lipopolysaccharide core heptosyltransferase RfaQ [Affinibrenneria salicis]